MPNESEINEKAQEVGIQDLPDELLIEILSQLSSDCHQKR